MDREFMKHYFEVAYEDAAGEIAKGDEQYQELLRIADDAIAALADMVGKSTAIWDQCEAVINSQYAVQLQLMELAYLRGAEDRDKMLR